MKQLLMRAEDLVSQFHEAFGVSINTGVPRLSDHELRMKLLREETEETCQAIQQGDLVEAVDGLCDVIYVALGAAVSWGVDLDPIFREVHRSNMAKGGGGRREDGKIMKPEGWTPPDVRGLLRKQGADV